MADAQQSEIDALKAEYPGKVKVICNIGEFTNVVSVQPVECDLQLKFQLTAMYPGTVPVISVKSSTLTADQITDLTSHLTERGYHASILLELVDFVASCKAWLLENDIDTTAGDQGQGQAGAKSGAGQHYKGKKKKKGKNKPPAEEPQLEKKPPMKTAMDVIKRLQWDKAVDKACFIVGYMDRLVGLVERAFVDFTWEDLASVDHFALAIPQHRIQYFKYKDEKVWDKNERLDNVFGSTGSHVTIVETVEKYEARQRQQHEEGENVAAGNEAKGVGNEAHAEDEAKTGTIEDTAGTGAKGVTKGEEAEAGRFDLSKLTATVSDLPGAPKGALGNSSLDSSADPRFEIKGRRNYFVAYQITDKMVLENLDWVMSDMELRYPEYQPHRNPIGSMHVTLTALTLTNIEELQKCVLTMNKIKQQLTELALQAEPVKFKGTGHFGSKVMFAKLELPPELHQMRELITNSLIEAGLSVEDKKSWRPHLTLFHVKRSDPWDDFDLDLRKYNRLTFGKQRVDNVQVCQMGTAPEDGKPGFYTTIFTLHP